ncbi:MAG: hypothetical protein ACOYOT_13450 [Bacteroidales bacterium]
MKQSLTYKTKILFLPIFLLVTSGITMYKVLVGEIGHHETWRIVASVVGFIGFFALVILAFVWLHKIQP